ncbi:MAG: erythromycin esterase family protein [Gemmatimonadaceae bacterium]
MPTVARATLPQVVADAAYPLTGGPEDFDPLLARIGDAPVVLIGEASHGTHEFYRIRAEITKRLIAERGFSAVAVEADWPDAYRVNRYVRGGGDDGDATEALSGFVRFPQWMWRNADVLDFVGWLRAFNETRPEPDRRVGFYGLDLYSLHASIDAVLQYLRKIDPEAAEVARERYACFDQFGSDPQTYGYATTAGLAPSCEAEVIAQLVELRRSAGDYARRDGRLAADDLFFAEQNARLVANAEQYYRAMFGSRVSSWNLRDLHMADTLDSLVAFLRPRVRVPKIIVWAHNSHLGDARATELGRSGELNLGQLARQRHAHDAVLVGFSTYAGTVTAATDWDAPAERKIVRPGLRGSYEETFHDTEMPNFLLLPSRTEDLRAALDHPRLQRAIGVIYRPLSERQSHYFHTHLPRQFDAVLHYDRTRAVEPLERTAMWERGEMPETYPTSL